MSTEPPEPQSQPDSQAQQEPSSPGPRAQRLQQIYSASLTRTLDKLSYENIATCYPTIARRASPVLHQVQSQMVERLREKCAKEFDAILTSREVIRKINDLEGLIADAESRRKDYKKTDEIPTPAHLLSPNDVLGAHLSPQLVEHQGLLNARLQTTQAQNAQVAETVRQQREEIEELLGKLDAAVEDVRCANGVLGGVVGELAKEARGVDAAMGDVSEG